jgi:hypothetical protein
VVAGVAEYDKRLAKGVETSAPSIVDIFGNGLHRAQASEEYLGRDAGISLFWLFLLYETALKQLFKPNET